MAMPNLKCVLGNHEWRFLSCWKQGRVPNIKPYDLATVGEMWKRFKAYMKFLSTFSLYVATQNYLVIHGGLRPGIPLRRQDPKDLTELRRIESTGRPWYESYRLKRPAIFGHWVRRQPLVLPNVIGLDTGCVYGGKLTAYLLPEKRLVRVRARKVYWERKKSEWE